jgi:uncharacterized MnhB-related membrane protein
MEFVVVVIACLICAVLAVRARRLLISALWLAGASALVALLLYLLGAPEIAVIELSVGAGLVTVLFVFAINIAGEEVHLDQSLIPMPIAVTLVSLAIIFSAILFLGPQYYSVLGGALPGFAEVIWKDRVLDVVLQVLLIFAGVLGVLGLLSEAKDPTKEVQGEH